MPVRPTARSDQRRAAGGDAQRQTHRDVPSPTTSSQPCRSMRMTQLASSIDVSEPAAVPDVAEREHSGCAPSLLLDVGQAYQAQLPNTMPPRAKQSPIATAGRRTDTPRTGAGAGERDDDGGGRGKGLLGRFRGFGVEGAGGQMVNTGASPCPAKSPGHGVIPGTSPGARGAEPDTNRLKFAGERVGWDAWRSTRRSGPSRPRRRSPRPSTRPRRNANPELTPDHLLVALTRQDDTIVPAVLAKLGLAPLMVRNKADEAVAKLPKAYGGDEPRLNRELNNVVENAEQLPEGPARRLPVGRAPAAGDERSASASAARSCCRR